MVRWSHPREADQLKQLLPFFKYNLEIKSHLTLTLSITCPLILKKINYSTHHSLTLLFSFSPQIFYYYTLKHVTLSFPFSI